MAIKITSALHASGTFPVDDRLVLSKAQMRTIDEDLFPDQYFCICSEDHKVYIFDFNFAANSVTGKFRPLDNYLTFDTAEAKEKFEDAIKASAEISSIKDTLGNAAERTGVFAEIDEAETNITNVTTSVNNLESKVVNELEPKVEQAKEDIKDIQTWIQNVKLDGGEIRATYTLTTTLTGVTLNSEDKSINYKEQKTFEFDLNEGYILPATIKINSISVGTVDTDCGTTIAYWEISTRVEGKPYGKLILKDTTNDVTCEIVATKEV